MKTTLITLALSILVSSYSCFAGDAAKHTYEGTITGVVCMACKQHVTAALTEKLEGTSDVKISAGDKEGEQKITIVSKSDSVTKDAAVKALGDLADDYQIVTLAKKD